MSHSIYTQNGQASMAYVGEVPWHGLGQPLTEGATIEEWTVQAGFDFRIQRAYVRYNDQAGILHKMPSRVVLHRSDTKAPLSVVSDSYKVVQPATVLEFFRDLSADYGWQLETAGVLGEGGKYWALARTNLDGSIAGDEHNAYVMLATSCDLSLATTAKLTSVRVVCANTLDAAMHSDAGKAVKIRHSTRFDPATVRKGLGLVDFEQSWADFTSQMAALSDIDVSPELAKAYFSELLRPTGSTPAERLALKADSLDALLDAPFGGRQHKATTDQASPERAIRGLADVMHSYEHAPGARPGTAYGLVQGVTHYLDHVRGKDVDARLRSAWFGQGEALKARAVEMAAELAA